MMATLDAAGYKETTRQQWQSAAEAWHRWDSTLRAWLGPATELMLDLAAVNVGSHVLDIAAGAGEPALSAARRVGPNGRVLATDISSQILGYADLTAKTQGLDGIVETALMDAENLDLSDATFDSVVCRLGLMYFPDKKRALTETRRVLRPGGRIAGIVFSTPETNQFFSRSVHIIRARAHLPPPEPGQPGPFSVGAPGVLESAMQSAGFRDVVVRAVNAPLRMSSAVECLRFQRESFGALHHMLAGLSAAEQEETWAEVGQALQEFEGPDGFEASCELLVGSGSR
jgi:SAM-dependent methyltransferase